MILGINQDFDKVCGSTITHVLIVENKVDDPIKITLFTTHRLRDNHHTSRDLSDKDIKIVHSQIKEPMTVDEFKSLSVFSQIAKEWKAVATLHKTFHSLQCEYIGIGLFGSHELPQH